MVRQNVTINPPRSGLRPAACMSCGRPFLWDGREGEPRCSRSCGSDRVSDHPNYRCIACGTGFRKRANTSTCSPECRIANRHGTLLIWKRVVAWEAHPETERPPCPLCLLSRRRSIADCGEECATTWAQWKLRITNCLFQCGAHTGHPQKLLCDRCIKNIGEHSQPVGAWLCWEDGVDNELWFPFQRAQALPAVNVCVLCEEMERCIEWGRDELRGVWGPWWAGSSAITRPR